MTSLLYQVEGPGNTGTGKIKIMIPNYPYPEDTGQDITVPAGMTEVRSISAIAIEIMNDWSKVYFGAEPYLGAMLRLDKVTDRYGHETGAEIILRFLVNAKTWRGETARRIKAELKEMIK